MNEQFKLRKSDLIPTFLPTVLAIVSFMLLFFSDIFNSRLLGIEEVIDSIINFTSIIIGVLVALFGIIVTISDTDIMKKIREEKGERLLFRYCLETLTSNFLLLIFSIIFQVLVNYSSQEQLKNKVDCYSYFWFSLIIFVFVSSFRTIYYLLMISFNQNDNTQRPDSHKLDKEKSLDLRKRYSK